MKVQWRDISTIIPYAQNPRVNSHAVDAVAVSIRKFGHNVRVEPRSKNAIAEL